jgi:hypothetical protein
VFEPVFITRRREGSARALAALATLEFLPP